MGMNYIDMRVEAHNMALNLTVQDQYNLAQRLATNCGYKLAPEDDENSLKVKTIISRMKNNGPAVLNDDDRIYIIKGLEELL